MTLTTNCIGYPNPYKVMRLIQVPYSWGLIILKGNDLPSNIFLYTEPRNTCVCRAALSPVIFIRTSKSVSLGGTESGLRKIKNRKKLNTTQNFVWTGLFHIVDMF